MIDAVTILTMADSTIGRFDANCIADDDQQMIELVCQDMLNFPFHQARVGTDFCTWKGLHCHWDSEDMANYVSIFWEPSALPACALYLAYLPRKTIQFTGRRGMSMGSLDVPRLPDCLEHLEISYNSYCGSLELNALPSDMMYCYLQNNKFSGSLSIQKLPSGLSVLNLKGNCFLSPIQLPKSRAHVISIESEYIKECAEE